MKDLDINQLRYAQIEEALALKHFVPPAKLKAFRARLRNYQKIGVVTSAPARGQKISYNLSDLITWGFCMELEELGLPPNVVKEIVVYLGEAVIDYLTTDTDLKKYVVVFGLFLQWHLEGDRGQGVAWNSGIYSAEEINERFLPICGNLLIVSLSGLQTGLVKALADSHVHGYQTLSSE